jgi:tRNA pseudouridine38-40 synthase
MKILLSIAYEGTNYFGWQIQNDFISVQEKIESALSNIYKSKISIIGSSRTDSGVHALNQKATFNIEHFIIPLDRLPKVINRNLPNDIVVTNCELVSDDFHPRYMAKRKIYEYKVYISRNNNPLLRNYCYNFSHELDLSIMIASAKYLIGTHDFKTFCSANSSVNSTIRKINSIDISLDNNIITFTFNGNGFLYNMIRIIVGTLIDFGYKKKEPSDMEMILKSCNRASAGKTAPPQGLTLLDIQY